MKHTIHYEVTIVVENDDELIDPTEAIDIDIKITNEHIKLIGTKIERLD